MRYLATLLALTAPALAASISLPGTAETASWMLNASNYPDGIPQSYGSATNPWSKPAAPTSGTAGAELHKIAGGGYISSGGFLYTAGFGIPAEQPDGSFRITDDSPLASLETIVFQGNLSEDNGIVPTLSYNGGSQSLAATFAGVYETGTNYKDYAWQWDLRGAGGPVTSYAIDFGGHFATPSLTVQAGTEFVQAVPEPSMLMLGIASLGFTLTRRRRA